MNVQELKNRFLKLKNYSTDDANELLDFARKIYIHNDININEYRKLVRHLEALGALIPKDKENSLIENTK